MQGSTICTLCKLLDWNEDGVRACPAFPAGIPDEILYRGFDHRNPYPQGDNGIRFVPRAGVKPEDVEARLAVPWGKEPQQGEGADGTSQPALA